MVVPFNTTSTKNTYMLFTGWEVRIGKNCDRGLNMLAEASGPRSELRSAYSGRGHSFSLYGPTISR